MNVQVAAATALGDTGDERAVEQLLTALKSDDESVRSASAEALGKIGGPAVEPLIASLKHVFWDVRAAAAMALGSTGDERAVDPLVRALKDPELPVRTEVKQALERLGRPS